MRPDGVRAEAPPSWLDSEEEAPDAPFRRGIFLPVTGSIKDSANGSDLALLRAGMVNSDGQPRSFPRCRLSARVPRIGTRVRVVGYGGSEVTADTETERVRKIVLALIFQSPKAKCLRCTERAGTPTGTLIANLPGTWRRCALIPRHELTVA